MKYYSLLLLLWSMLYQNGLAQNLVPNPSFEKFSSCPTEYDQVDRAIPWQKYQGSPDFFSSCAQNNAIKIPKNFFGYALPPTGGNCVGIASFHKTVPNEMMGVKLKEPLRKGKKYKAGFKALLGQTYSGLATNNMGILFTNSPEASPYATKAQIRSNDIIDSGSGWALVEGEFTAEDNYEYLVIGMFYKREECKVETRPQSFNSSSYYFIDDVFVYPISDCPENYNYTGKVIDEDTEKPLSAVIKYTNNNTNVTQTTQTQDGNYNITLEDCYTYNIEITAEGYYSLIEVDYKPEPEKKLPFPEKMIPLKQGKTIVIKHVYFDFNKSFLQEASYFELNILVEVLKKNSQLSIEIAGHTDNVGTDSYNLQLSKDRANAVKSYLVSKGISNSRLKAVGYGEEKPKTSNDTDAGRALNRRVEFTIL